MEELIRFARRVVLRWQIRSLVQQAAYIVEARSHALVRLRQIRRERRIKRKALMMCKSPNMRRAVDEGRVVALR